MSAKKEKKELQHIICGYPGCDMAYDARKKTWLLSNMDILLGNWRHGRCPYHEET